MDIPREAYARKKKIRRILWSAAGLFVVLLVTLGLSRLKPAAPPVDSGTIWPDTVKQGAMLIQVRGLGSLVPEQILWIPATTDGRIVKRLVLAGSPVHPDTVIVTMVNPELEQATLDAEWQVKEAQAQTNSLKAQLDNTLMDQRAAAATVHSDYIQAQLTAEKDETLAKLGLGAELNVKLDKAKADSLQTRDQIEQDRVKVSAASAKAQLEAQEAKVEQLRALYELKRSQMDALSVRAGAEGVVQEVPVEEGQRVTAGTIIAKIVQPEKLKAELKIPETQVKDILIGQPASIDTHNGIIPGRVSRVDPAAANGTFTVDVHLEGALPSGARPDQRGGYDRDRKLDRRRLHGPTRFWPAQQHGQHLQSQPGW